MPNRNLFIISSSINSNIGNVDPRTRFLETIETIDSVRDRASGSIILLIDNSIQRLSEDLEDIVRSRVDFYIYIGNRKPCIEFNRNGVRSAGEAYILLVAIDFIQRNLKDPIDRVFKLSGRYRLTSEFDISEYDDERYRGRYCFRVDDVCLHTRLWSFCSTLIKEVKRTIQDSLVTIFNQQINIEEALFIHIDKKLLINKEKIHCEGKPALWSGIHITE